MAEIHAPDNWIISIDGGACDAVMDKLNAMAGSGFDTDYHSLQQIAEALGLEVPPTPPEAEKLDKFTFEVYNIYTLEITDKYTIGGF